MPVRPAIVNEVAKPRFCSSTQRSHVTRLLGQDLQGGSDLPDRQNQIGPAYVASRERHLENLRAGLVLSDRQSTPILDGAGTPGTVPAISRQHHADRSIAVYLGNRPEQDVRGRAAVIHALAIRQAQHAVRPHPKMAIGRGNVDRARAGPVSLPAGHDPQSGPIGKDFRQQVGEVPVNMLADQDRQWETVRQIGNQQLESLDAACR